MKYVDWFIVAVCVVLLQYERMRRVNAELEEKLEAAEIQVKQQSVEYRTILQQKEVTSSLCTFSPRGAVSRCHVLFFTVLFVCDSRWTSAT